MGLWVNEDVLGLDVSVDDELGVDQTEPKNALPEDWKEFKKIKSVFILINKTGKIFFSFNHLHKTKVLIIIMILYIKSYLLMTMFIMIGVVWIYLMSLKEKKNPK